MSTRPTPVLKKASDSFHQLWGNLKSNVTQQSQLRSAVYNFVIVAVVAACVAVCLVLGPFLKPLLWALLVGAVLFPFKYSLSSALKCWFARLEKDDTHLLVGIALAPLEALDGFGAYLWSSFIKHMQLLIGGTVGLFLLRIFIAYAPKGIFCAAWRYIRWSHTLCTNVLGSLDYTIVIAVLFIYLTCVTFLWKQDNSFYFMLLGQGLWVVLVAYACSFLGALQVPVLMATLTYSLAGFIYNVKYSDSGDGTDENAADRNLSILEKCASFWESPTFNSTPQRTATAESPVPVPSSVENVTATSNDGDALEETLLNKTKAELKLNANDDSESGRKSQSGIYFKALFLACLVTILYRQLLMLCLAFIPIAIFLCNKLLDMFGFKEYAWAYLQEIGERIQNWLVPRHSALLPLCLPGVIRLNSKVDKLVRSLLQDSIDTASSIIVIILLIFVVCFASIFCAVEIYSETITVVQLGSDVVNYTLNHRPELMDMFPEGMQDSMENAMENAYLYGRTGIETYLDEFLKEADKEQRRKLKEQVLSIWDRMIQYWMDKQKGTTGPGVPSTAITDSIGEIVYNQVAQQGMISLIKTNIGMLLEVTDSVWLIVKQNLNILTSIFGTLLSMLLGGGHAVITFLVNAIIFLTALFYLLSSSEDKYCPLAATNYLGFSSGQRIAEAIEASISSVLMASTKLALFHGLFMWLTHTIFGARVVFLPAVFAGILAAVPFLGTYWCSIPAFHDLWLIQDRFALGVALVLIHFLFPTSFVDPAIYADVNGGGHAYLTGLSIAGGMFWLGWEGAIFGPILLCLLVVIFNLTTNAMRESPGTPQLRNPLNVTNLRISYAPNMQT